MPRRLSMMRGRRNVVALSFSLVVAGAQAAELGKTREAREVLLQSIDARGIVEPNSDYWYAFGRIAEQYGERDIALADYAKVTQPIDPAREWDSTYRLAQKRLAVLGRRVSTH